LTHLDSVA